MFKKFDLFGRQFSIMMSKYEDVDGYSSYIPKYKGHILMVDCDSTKYEQILHILQYMQQIHEMSEIVILDTGRPESFHVLCYDIRPFREWFRILSMYNIGDKAWLANCLKREEFILRMSPKGGRFFELKKILYSKKKPDATHADISEFIRYRTFSRV